jgi:glyoxylase-like metal-dependent hydrolase (beta-lactamase superfamily II)
MADNTDTQVAIPEVPPVVTAEPVEVADGIYVVPDGGVPLVPNLGVVLGSREALVVDTAMGPQNGARARTIAEQLADGRPLLLTITHFHPEHGYGAQAFTPGATIVYNRAQLEELRAKGLPYLEMFRGFSPGIAEQLEGVELVEPQVVCDGEADLELGGRQVQLRTWGLAHTRSDQVVFVPDEGVLFTGDLVESRCFAIFPYFPPDDADVDGDRWIAVLERLERLEPRVVVPGHGPVGDAGVIATAREYIQLLREETRRLAAEGLELDEIVDQVDRSMRALHPDWAQPEWIAFGVRAFHAALAGAPA